MSWQARLRFAASDAGWLLVLWLGVGLLATGFGFGSQLYLRVSAVLFLTALPGWWLSALFGERDLLLRLLLAHGAALVGWGLVATTCWALGLGFEVWWAIHLALGLGALGLACARGGYDQDREVGRELVLALRSPAALAIVPAALLLAAYWRAPVNNDLELFAPHLVEYQRARAFEWASPVAGFEGPDGVPPRFRAHLLHVHLALLADAAGTNAAALVSYGAATHLGMLLWLGLAGFLRAASPSLPGWSVAAAPLLPITLLHLPGQFFSPYTQPYALLNGPALDKHFALLFLYPLLLVLLLRWLERGRLQEGLFALAAAPVALWVHPLTPIYALLGSLAVVLARPEAPLRRRALALGWAALLAGIAVAIQTGYGDQGWAEKLVAHDLTRDRRHFWIGRYAAAGIDTGEVRWVAGRMLLRPGLLAEAGVAAACFAVWALARRRAMDPAAQGAFRLQLSFLGLLLLVQAGGTALLWVAPHLHLGVVRLHWFFLGSIGEAHLLALAGGGLAAAARKRGVPLRPAAAALLGLYLLPQLVWLARSPAEFMNDPAQAETRPARWLLEQARTYPRTGAPELVWNQTERAGYGARLWAAPEWLRPEDRVYARTLGDQSGMALGWRATIEHFPLLPRLVYYPEQNHEAFALERRGEAFLAAFDAFWDGYDGRVTPRLVEWLRRERVTILIAPERPFAEELAAALGCRLIPLDPLTGTWRLEPR